jgi:hypothetical protein
MLGSPNANHTWPEQSFEFKKKLVAAPEGVLGRGTPAS